MHFNLKSFKTLCVFSNGCVCFSSSVYSKSFKKYHFFKKNLVMNSIKPSQTITKHSNFFYFKYRDQIPKSLIYEFTISRKKY
jgi:hypothetical protein